MNKFWEVDASVDLIASLMPCCPKFTDKDVLWQIKRLDCEFVKIFLQVSNYTSGKSYIPGCQQSIDDLCGYFRVNTLLELKKIDHPISKCIDEMLKIENGINIFRDLIADENNINRLTFNKFGMLSSCQFDCLKKALKNEYSMDFACDLLATNKDKIKVYGFEDLEVIILASLFSDQRKGIDFINECRKKGAVSCQDAISLGLYAKELGNIVARASKNHANAGFSLPVIFGTEKIKTEIKGDSPLVILVSWIKHQAAAIFLNWLIKLNEIDFFDVRKVRFFPVDYCLYILDDIQDIKIDVMEYYGKNISWLKV